jgi:tetratricopeptide (TPR) repeat protein
MTLLVRRAAAALMLGWLTCSTAAEPDGYTQAVELHQQGDDAAALARVDAYLAEHPRDSRARFLKGVVLAKQNRVQEAVGVLTALSEEFPELPEPHNNLAVLYAGQGKYEEARRELEMAVRASPDYAIAYQNLGDVYAALAAQAYEKALRVDATSEVARTRLEAIRRLLPEGAVAAAPLAVSATATAAAATAPQPTIAQESSPAPPAAADKPTTAAAASPPSAPRTVLGTVEDWAKAWSSKDVEKYLSFYARDFRTPKGEPRGNWEAARREQLTKPRIIAVEVVEPKVTVTDPNHATVAFKQNYRADAYRSSGRKTLQLVRQGDRWLIQQETITFR